MTPVEAMQARLDSLFPGLMGVRIVSLEPEKVLATLLVRPDLCTAGADSRRPLHPHRRSPP